LNLRFRKDDQPFIFVAFFVEFTKIYVGTCNPILCVVGFRMISCLLPQYQVSAAGLRSQIAGSKS